MRILLPPTLFILLLGETMARFDSVYDAHGLLVSYLAVPFIYVLVMGLPSLIIVATLKWLLVGRYRSAEIPMWAPFVWLSEPITTIYEGLNVPLLPDALRGSPFLPWAWRLSDVRVGAASSDTSDITEFDLVRIDDDAALAEANGPQTHLFEDRVMKIGPVHIGARSVPGTNAIALYGSEIGEDARIGSLSLVMKSEAIPPGATGSGSPARAHG
jgi:non-ribosomal peptide synthetase-like protein